MSHHAKAGRPDEETSGLSDERRKTHHMEDFP